MKRKRKSKIIIIMLIFLTIIFNTRVVFAQKDISEQGKDWLNTGEKNQPKGKDSLGSVLDAILNIQGDSDHTEGFQELAGLLWGIGIFVVAIVGVWLGIRLMFSNAEDKAKSKEALQIYLIGTIIIFGSLGIWKLLIILLDGDYLY